MWCDDMFDFGRATKWDYDDGLGINPKADPEAIGFAIFILRKAARLSLYQDTPEVLMTGSLEDIASKMDFICTKHP